MHTTVPVWRRSRGVIWGNGEGGGGSRTMQVTALLQHSQQIFLQLTFNYIL
jgi:hypothetical protein